MKALVKTEPGITDLHVMDVPKPDCPDDGVILKVRAVGICGSDIHFYKWLNQPPLPLIMGHEFCGDIVEVGKNVKGWKVGEFVVSRVAGDCGECQACQEGFPEMCEHKLAPGTFARGAYAEYIESYPRYLLRVPEGVSEEMAACSEPAAVALHAAKRFNIQFGDTVVVSGVGIIGLLSIQYARIRGAKEIIAVGVESDLAARLPLAQKYGATKIINAQAGSTAEQILAYTKGRKADVVIDCSGVLGAIDELFKVVKRMGTYGAIGVPPTDSRVSVDWFTMVCSSYNIISSYASNHKDWQDVLSLMASGQLAFQDAISNIISLEEWEKVFKHSSDPDYIKAVIKPWKK